MNQKEDKVFFKQVAHTDMDDKTWFSVDVGKNKNIAHPLHTQTQFAVFGKKHDGTIEQCSECYDDSFSAAARMDEIKAQYAPTTAPASKKKGLFGKTKSAPVSPTQENPYKVIALQCRQRVFWGSVWHSIEEETEQAEVEDVITDRSKVNFKQMYAAFAPTAGQGTEDPFDGDYVQVTAAYDTPEQAQEEYQHLVESGTLSDHIYQDPSILVRQTFETYDDWKDYKRVDMNPIIEYASTRFNYNPDEPITNATLGYADYKKPN